VSGQAVVGGRSTSPLAVRGMRVALLLVCWFLPLVALGSAPDCESTGLRPRGTLTATEWKTVTSNSPTSDPVILEARFLLNKGSDDLSAEELRQAVKIPWSQARRLILLGSVTRVRLALDSGVYLVTLRTRSGKSYSTREAAPHDLTNLVKLVDPCGIYITIWQP
jgi:hypothetical protein